MANIKFDLQEQDLDGNVPLDVEISLGDDLRWSDLGDIDDANGNEMLEFDTVASAVNFLRLANSATGSDPVLSAQGDDANVGLRLDPKGTGVVEIRGTDAGVNGGALDLNHVSASPLANDNVGILRFKGLDDALGAETFGVFQVRATDISAGAEVSQFMFFAHNSSGTIAQCSIIGHDGTNAYVSVGDAAGAGVFQSDGNFDVILRTGNATTGNITITDGADGNITLTPNGSGAVDLAGAILHSETTTSSGAGAVAITGSVHEITTTGAGDALTLADGTEGQLLHIVYVAEGAGGDTAVLTPTNLGGADTTITFNDLGDAVTLLFTAGAWYGVGVKDAVFA